MSAMESLIWTILGYASMPAVFIVGFVITAVVTCMLIEMSGNGLNE